MGAAWFNFKLLFEIINVILFSRQVPFVDFYVFQLWSCDVLVCPVTLVLFIMSLHPLECARWSDPCFRVVLLRPQSSSKIPEMS